MLAMTDVLRKRNGEWGNRPKRYRVETGNYDGRERGGRGW